MSDAVYRLRAINVFVGNKEYRWKKNGTLCVVRHIITSKVGIRGVIITYVTKLQLPMVYAK